jgi:topoisomerase IA-like protein
MLAELAAANAAFGVIKSFISNGKELASCGKQISDFVFAKEEIERKAKKQRAKGVRTNDLEEFMALEQLKQKEEELKQIMIYAGRPGLWADWQKFQAEARKSRRYAEKMAQKRREELLEMMGYSIAFIALLAFGGMILYFVGKWTGKL